MRIPVDKFTNNLFDWQLDTLVAFDKHTARFFMAECHRRSRKTTLIINILIRECLRNPKSVYPYIGPTYKQAKSIVWRDPNMLFSYLPDRNECPWVANESELFIRFPNGSILPIKGADDPDSLRGLDAHGVGFDEWALMKEAIWYEIFRPIIAQDPRRWAFFGYTPKGENHATEMFNLACCLGEGGTLPTCGPAKKLREDWFAIRILASKSGIISKKELDKAREEMPLSLYDQEFECARTTQEERTLITSAMIEALKERIWTTIKPTEARKIISCDPAFGGHECVAKAIENTKTIDKEIMHYRDTAKVVGTLLNMSYKNDIRNFIVDCIGNGKGVADGLSEKSDKARPLNVQYFNSAEKSDDPRFANKRAEAWWWVMQQVYDKEIQYPADNETRRQIPYASKYDMARNGRLIIIPKPKIVELCGCSPDRAECWMMGQYGLQNVEPVIITDWDRRHRKKQRSPMSM